MTTTRSQQRTPSHHRRSKSPSSTTSKNKTKKNQADWSMGVGFLPGRAYFGPLFLMMVTPPFSIVYYHVCTQLEGNFVAFFHLLVQDGVLNTLYNIWPSPYNATVWKWIVLFASFQLLLMKIVPGRTFAANMTPSGHVPTYTANGMACYVITLGALLLLAVTDTFDPAQIYDHFGVILSCMNIFAWILCLGLYIKGHMAPSTADSGTTGNVLQDVFWGMELYPRVWGWDVKVFTNCRMGMMFWAVAIVSFAYKNMQLHHGQLQYGMTVSVALQLVYITKFYHWEMGYMCSMDIQHDRAGYYICWGCLVWVPAVYTSQAFYLTAHGPDLSLGTALAIFVTGLVMIFINYDSDQQRYLFRQTNGQCLVWGRVPHKIVATYRTASGQVRTSLLLVDGWWTISRHFHYIPEILAALCWSLPALTTNFVAPYFYVVYLTILLTDRAFRDDDRCANKYGKDWDKYCEAVPWKILPGIV